MEICTPAQRLSSRMRLHNSQNLSASEPSPLNGIHAGALYLQPKALRLLLHVRAYGEAVYAVREAGIVIHLCRLYYLASYQHVLKEHSIHVPPLAP